MAKRLGAAAPSIATTRPPPVRLAGNRRASLALGFQLARQHRHHHTRAVTVYRDTLSEGFSHFVTSMTAPVASGWSGCRVGLAPTGKRRLFTAHTPSGRSFGQRLTNVRSWAAPPRISSLCTARELRETLACD